MSALRLLFRRLLIAANALLPLVMIVAGGTRRWELFAWVAPITFAAHGLMLWAILHPRCVWLGPLVTRFATEKKEVWLTLDDGPTEGSAQLAEELRARGVRATFFVIGTRHAARPDAAQAILAAGHTLANHSATHPRLCFWRHGHDAAAREVEGGAVSLHGAGRAWFRAPAGHKPPALHRVLASRGWRLIAWTVGGRDGWSADPRATVARVIARARPGAIVMLHEGRAHSAATVLAVVDALLARGFAFTIPDDAQLRE